MGKVAITMKVLPSDVKVNLEEVSKKVQERLKKDCEIYKVKIEPIAFGINALVFLFLRDETLGTEDLVEDISKIEGVGDVVISDISLVHGL